MTDDPDDPTPDDLPEPPADDVFRSVLWLMEQARRRGFRIGPMLKVGSVQMQIVDIRQPKLEGYTPPDDGPGIWESAGHTEGE